MKKDLFDLAGRTALVTGGSRGIGQSIAEALAAHGAHVVVSSRNADDCEATAAAIREAGGSADALACNIGDLGQITAAAAEVARRHGKLDILVNNAAANPYYGPILDTPPEAFQKTVDVNIRGYFYMSVEAGRLMREHGGGVILNTASTNALTPPPLQAIYSITKAAVVSMTKAFARECARDNIRCNALLPGLTRTRFAGGLFEDERLYRSILSMIPMRRHAEPDEMAGAALYLVSDAASFTTGQVIVVDGGMTC